MIAQTGSHTRTVNVVIKMSKLCNLRCRYCYEFAELNNPLRVTHAQLRALYENLTEYYSALDHRDGECTQVSFIWHGGEPLLAAPEFYWETFTDQEEIFAGRVHRSNNVQTNLTVLDSARLRLLRDGFDAVGVSVDLFGGHRVNVAGRDLQHVVLRNMDRLTAEGVSYGTIGVLHRGNLSEIDRIWRFYERAGLHFRVLPLFTGATTEQNAADALTAQEIVTAMCRLADLWLSAEVPVPVDPIVGQVYALIRHLDPNPDVKRYYTKRQWCATYLVNTNGSCFSSGDPYGDPQWILGDAFTTPLADIFAGEVFERSAQQTDRRIAANCLGCPFFGGCDGMPVGDDLNNIYEYRDGVAVCRVDRAVLTHLSRRFEHAELLDSAGRLRTLGFDTGANGSLVVA